MDKRIKEIILSEEQIDNKITELAIDINHYYKDKDIPIMLGLLNGCAVFYGQLLTRLNFTLETDFLREKKDHKGNRQLSYSMNLETIRGRNILVIEDILDTGDTLNQLTNELALAGAKDIKSVVLIDKTSSRNTPFKANWTAYTTDTQEWLAGFGTDFTNDLVSLQHIVSLNKK